MKNQSSIALLYLFSATTSFAQDFCHRTPLSDDLLGNYSLELGPGTLTAISLNGAERVHIAPMNAGTATIAIHDDVPVLYSDDLATGGVLEMCFDFYS